MGLIAKHIRSTAAIIPRCTTNKLLHGISKAVDSALMEAQHTYSATEKSACDTEAWKVWLPSRGGYELRMVWCLYG